MGWTYARGAPTGWLKERERERQFERKTSKLWRGEGDELYYFIG